MLRTSEDSRCGCGGAFVEVEAPGNPHSSLVTDKTDEEELELLSSSELSVEDRNYLKLFPKRAVKKLVDGEYVELEWFKVKPWDRATPTEANVWQFQDGKYVRKKTKKELYKITDEADFMFAVLALLQVRLLVNKRAPSMVTQNREVLSAIHRLMKYNKFSWEVVMDYFEQLRISRPGLAEDWAKYDQDLLLTVSMKSRSLASGTSGSAGQVDGKKKAKFSIPTSVANDIKAKDLCFLFQLGRCSKQDKHEVSHQGQTVKVRHRCYDCKSTSHGLHHHG
jgi:hypothetical protein